MIYNVSFDLDGQLAYSFIYMIYEDDKLYWVYKSSWYLSWSFLILSRYVCLILLCKVHLLVYSHLSYWFWMLEFKSIFTVVYLKKFWNSISTLQSTYKEFYCVSMWKFTSNIRCIVRLGFVLGHLYAVFWSELANVQECVSDF